jgi:4-amino-4-deoxy-L-arabinose transferase-like glycosyltransferase
MGAPVERPGGGARQTEVDHSAVALAAIAALALAVRLVYALAIAPGQPTPGDSLIYHALANSIAHGDGYNLAEIYHRSHPTASHPPLYPLYLAAFVKLGISSYGAQRAVSCLLGTIAVVLVGLVGRRIAGPRVGLIAAGIAAVYPQLFMVDGTLLAEALFAPLVVLALLLAYRLLERPTIADAAALGATIGLATLARSDGIMLLVLLVVPVAWRVGRGRFRLMAVAALAAALVLSPWLVRNWIQFDRFPLLSTNGALTQLATNCPETYYGERTGFVFHQCALRSTCLAIKEEVPQADCLLREARGYVRHHLTRVPVVAAARVARQWNVYDPGQDREYGELWAREKVTATIGMAMYAALVLLAIYGAILLRRRRVALLPLLALLVFAALVALIAFGFSRYRLAAEPALVILAAVAVERLVADRLTVRWRGAAH